jgi:glycosyltransferase involved in cell wall biosynthesis
MPGEITVFSPEKEATLLGPDNSIRSWRQSKSLSRLGRILASPEAKDIDVFVIQFNYGFYNHTDLANFIYQIKDQGKSVLICLHATFLINLAPYDNFQLPYLAPALAACDRILVHSVDDLNNLKQLGLIDNVALFPHGVLSRSDTVPPRAKIGEATIATYGFALPHKGLPEMLQALCLLRDRGRKVRLRMVNAEYPVDVSAALVHDLKAQIRDLGLSDYVEMHNQFLPDEDSLALLTDSDLVVFPYQNTAESASGAVRYGMAVQRPVAVTPLPIFSDIEGASFRMGGTSPADLADGIAAALDAIAANTPEAIAIAEQAARWREQHDYRVVGKRLYHMCKALASR